jgi:hypothetical protein
MVEVFGGSPGFPASIIHNIGVMMGGGDFVTDVFYHAHLWLGGLALPLVVFASWLASRAPSRRRLHRVLFPTTLFGSGPDGRALAIWLVALSLFVEFAMFRELYSFYFALIYPFLALCAAYVIQRGITPLAPPAASDDDPEPGHRPLRPLLGAGLALAGLVVVGLHGAASFDERYVFPDEQEVLGALNEYEWTDPPVLVSLAGITKELFWEDHRLRGDFEPGYRHYLWSKKRGFSVLDDVAEHIRQHSAEDETIAGSSTLAPLVALLSERRIAADEVDTNTKRFSTKLMEEETYWNAICDDRVRFIVSAPNSYFTEVKLGSLPLMRRAFERVAEFEDRTLRYNKPFPIHLYRRIDGAECRWP